VEVKRFKDEIKENSKQKDYVLVERLDYVQVAWNDEEEDHLFLGMFDVFCSFSIKFNLCYYEFWGVLSYFIYIYSLFYVTMMIFLMNSVLFFLYLETL